MSDPQSGRSEPETLLLTHEPKQTEQEESSPKNSNNQSDKSPSAPLTAFVEKSPGVDSSTETPMGRSTAGGKSNSDDSDAKIKELEKQLKLSSQKIKKLKEIEARYNDITQQDEHRSSTKISAWWEKLYQTLRDNLQRTGEATYDPEELGKVRKYPGSIIELLYHLQYNLNHERKKWNDWFTGRDKTIKNLDEQVFSLKSQLQSKDSRIRDLERIEADYSSIKGKNDELERRCTKLLTDITILKTGDASTPQHEALYNKFRELKEQDFKEFSNKIFKLRSQCNADMKAERKTETARIRSKLAEAILLKGVEIGKEKRKMTEADIEKVSNKLENYFAYGLLKLDSKNNPNDAILSEISDDLKKLVKRGLELANDIGHALPPAELLWYEKEKEVAFDSEEHEALLGCTEKGKIEFTVHPGYAVYEENTKKRRIFEKATVFTSLEKDKKSS